MLNIKSEAEIEETCLKGFLTSAVKFEVFAEQWFEDFAKPNLRNTTYERMLQLRKRVYPAIGHLRLDKISPRHIQTFVNTLSKEGANERTGKPLAPKTIRHNLSLISDVFSYAVRMGMVSDNSCGKVTIPKDEHKEKQIYTPSEVEMFLELLNIEPLKYKTFFYLLLYSGFRRGEMLGLQWGDIDFEHNVISIRRTSNYTAKQGVYTDTTKTRKSQRTLKFPQFIMDMLKEYKEEQDMEALRLGDKWVETDRLYVKWNGEPMQNGTPYFWLGEFCEKHGLPFYRLHSFRQRRFTIAHEIGHLVLGHNTQGNIKFRYSLFNSENAGTAHPCEIVANVFARNLLMPTVILKEIGLHTPREIMQACNVSYRSASVCAKRMRVLCKHNEWKTTPLEMKIRNRFMPFIERFRKIRKNP